MIWTWRYCLMLCCFSKTVTAQNDSCLNGCNSILNTLTNCVSTNTYNSTPNITAIQNCVCTSGKQAAVSACAICSVSDSGISEAMQVRIQKSSEEYATVCNVAITTTGALPSATTTSQVTASSGSQNSQLLNTGSWIIALVISLRIVL